MRLTLEASDYKDGQDVLHDIIVDIDDKVPTVEEMDQILVNIPHSILATAFEWGFNDTCVRDSIYVWYRDEYKELV